MSKPIVLPVILAGGSGERLWPLSRSAYPKQFLTILGAKVSLFQATLQRLPVSSNFLPPLIVCHEDHRFLVAEQMRQIDVTASAIILEPIAKNTAPAIALAAQWANSKYPNVNLLVLPADHYMPDTTNFANTITTGLTAAKQDYIVTFGVPVTRAETGYGYIEKGSLVQPNCYAIQRFIEKPTAEVAATLISNAYYWNSGMFLFTSTCILDALRQYAPAITTATKDAMLHSTQDQDFIRANLQYYQTCPHISIDYAVMEKTHKAAVTALNTSWSDVGSWQAVWEHSTKDIANNYSSGDVVMHETRNCHIEARHRLVTAVDVADLAIVETNDAVLVTKRDNSTSLKALVNTLKQQGHLAANLHRQVMRPWGYYDSLIKGPRFQVKLIVVQPGKGISLQLHNHRSEHWVVVKGSAKVLRGTEEFMLSENESTFIPIGMKHQLSNIGKIPLEVIEVQSGSYLGEDDIIRLEEEHAYA